MRSYRYRTGEDVLILLWMYVAIFLITGLWIILHPDSSGKLGDIAGTTMSHMDHGPLIKTPEQSSTLIKRRDLILLL